MGCVALRKESVDRNIPNSGTFRSTHKSLSARRAWIETLASWSAVLTELVALRKESVDRNKYVVQCRKMLGVALRKESVDRNGRGNIMNIDVTGRSPQGERG